MEDQAKPTQMYGVDVAIPTAQQKMSMKAFDAYRSITMCWATRIMRTDPQCEDWTGDWRYAAHNNTQHTAHTTPTAQC